MSLKIYDEDKGGQDVLLRLIPIMCDGVMLVSVDNSGETVDGGNILKITNGGSLKLQGSIRAPGINTGDSGRIKIVT